MPTDTTIWITRKRQDRRTVTAQQGVGRTTGRTERRRFSIRRIPLDVFWTQSWAIGSFVLLLASLC